MSWLKMHSWNGLCGDWIGRHVSGQGIGAESDSDIPVLEPVLTYRLELPEGCDVHGMLIICAAWKRRNRSFYRVDRETQEIHIRLMGEVQTEVLQRLIKNVTASL